VEETTVPGGETTAIPGNTTTIKIDEDTGLGREKEKVVEIIGAEKLDIAETSIPKIIPDIMIMIKEGKAADTDIGMKVDSKIMGMIREKETGTVEDEDQLRPHQH